MVMHMDELEATVQMMLYTNSSYTEAYSSAPTLELRDKVGQLSATTFSKCITFFGKLLAF